MDEFSVARFYERRIRRIFPALFVTIPLTIAAGAILFVPVEFRDLGKSAAGMTLTGKCRVMKRMLVVGKG